MNLKYIKEMKALQNSAYLMGRLEMDPEIFDFGDGKSKVEFSLATSDFALNKSGERIEETQLHTIVALNKLGEIAAKFLKKGRVVAVVGKLTNRKFADANGQYGFRTEIVVNELLMLDNQN